ncbi:hypothetical protein GJA_5409 [Janthinobacterium agaricidamnosum NBRC 102515 = DSM 9628]|uniref:Uncharacterized protein n=1 Tax=Janthinobacterium agaricidamnosum NBRC 102515 = DSM 9628 TaxID=1349767 RepID=W0VE94_9BURK|nr:hypothetical protein GJA_5409 [Janthinobacterium agaricidamnosum NBRC 102515 = DSM 9628]
MLFWKVILYMRAYRMCYFFEKVISIFTTVNRFIDVKNCNYFLQI